MANISLKLGRHPKTEPIGEVIISWTGGINVQRLKTFLKGEGALLPAEQALWEIYKDKKEWLYCFVGHFDDVHSVNECYDVDENAKVALKQFSISRGNIDMTRIWNGSDVKLDIGKVVDQKLKERIKQHFDDGTYLEHYRKSAIICFPEYIKINRGEYIGEFCGENKDDFIDALETILIKGNAGMNLHRLGVCNDMKKVNPQLFYPIRRLSSITNMGAMEKQIYVTIEEN